MSLKSFARVEALLRLIHEKCDAAEARHSGFKRQTGAQRCFFKKHHHLLAGERLRKSAGRAFISPAR